jgi:hypothetical protein
MRTVKALFLAVSCATFCCGCHNIVSQKSGNLAILKGAKVVNVQYSYEGMRVGKLTEQEFVRKQVEDRDKKSPGAGATWSLNWKNNPVARYQPKFEELLNKQLAARHIDLNFGNHPEAEYTLLLKTSSLKLGYQAWVAARPAFLDADAIFFQTTNPQNQVAVVTFREMVGTAAYGVPFEQGGRVLECYAKTGKELGIRVAKKIK